VADRYPLWNVELANAEQRVDNRLAASIYFITGVDESKTRVIRTPDIAVATVG
jgi:hypothetical protein